uniref:Uncharacterized protein n=1 Tax=Magallana gigas TaxID=29159 RepID=K1QLN6_MAGGI
MKPYCIITGGLANSVIDAERCIDKPWFNDICKSKYRDYRGALHNFNVCKSDVNRIVLCAKKKVYKKCSFHVNESIDEHIMQHVLVGILGILVTSRAPSPRMVPNVNRNVTRVLKRHVITFMAVQ